MILQQTKGIKIASAHRECVAGNNLFGYSSPHFMKKGYAPEEYEKEFVIDAISFSHEVKTFEQLFSLCSVVPSAIAFSEEQVIAVVRQKKEEVLAKKADAIFFVLDEGGGVYSVACVFFTGNFGAATPGIVKVSLDRGPYFKGYFPHMLIVPSKE